MQHDGNEEEPCTVLDRVMQELKELRAEIEPKPSLYSLLQKQTKIVETSTCVENDKLVCRIVIQRQHGLSNYHEHHRAICYTPDTNMALHESNLLEYTAGRLINMQRDYLPEPTLEKLCKRFPHMDLMVTFVHLDDEICCEARGEQGRGLTQEQAFNALLKALTPKTVMKQEEDWNCVIL